MDYYQNENGDYVEGSRTILNDPDGRAYIQMQDEVAAGTSTIIPWTEYRDTSDEDLREIRYTDNAAYADSLIATAKLTPEQGSTYTARQVAKQDSRRNNFGRGNKIAKVSDADDYLFDWIDTVYDAQDQADDTVENLNRAALEAWTPDTATWPAWAPYVP